MSKTVDQRVVEMKFDNRHFEKNVSTTMSTLDKLKAKLNFSGAAKGLSGLTSHANIVKKNMDVLGQGVRSVQAEFSGLSVIGATCLVNLTNSAIRASKNIVNALTLDPVKTGFNEYETKINAIQTILANTSSKGENIESVTKVIDELNTYADKTIYNFSEMTRNIGTFTAAGVGLKESANAIQGIANVAAMSGSSSQQASTAMYQLSQALAAGTVKLMDWNSVVNAGMGGEKLQEALKQTAREFGTNVDAIIADAGSFRDSLQEGWITADVLNTTLKKFTVEGAKEYADSMVKAGKYTQEQADALLKEAQMAEDAATKVKTLTQLYDTLKETAQSGWGKTWELMFGNFEEAKSFFTDLNDKLSPIIDKMSDARNNLIEGALTSKWTKFTKHVEDAGGSMDKFKESLAAVLEEEHGWELDSMINRYGSLEKAMQSGRVSTDDIITAFKRLTGESSEVNKSTQAMTDKLEAFQKIVDRVWSGEFGNGESRIKALADAGYEYSKIQDLVNKTTDGHRLTLEDLTDEQLKSIGCTNEEIVAYGKLARQAKQTGTPLRELIDNIQKPSGRELLLDSLMNAINGVIKLCSTLKEAWQDVFPPMTADGLYGVIESIHNFSEKLVMSDETAEKMKRTLKGVFAILDVITTVLGGGFTIALKIAKAILSLFNLDILDLTAYVGDAAVNFRDWVDSVFDIKGAISFLLPYLEKGVNWVKKWIDVFKGSVDMSKLFSGKNPFEGGFSGMVKSISEFASSGMSLKDIFSFEAGKNFAKNLFDGIQNGIETHAPKIAEKVKKAFKGIVNIIKNIDYGSIAAGLLMGGMLFTINNVAKAFTSIADTIAKVLNKFAAPFVALAKLLDNVGELVKAKAFNQKATGILKIVAALAILAGAVYILGKMDIDALIQGGVAVAVLSGILIGLMVAAKKLGSISISAEVATNGMLKLAGSLLIIAASIALLASIDSDGMESAIMGLTAAVLALGILMFAMNALTAKSGKMIAAGSMLFKMAAAMLIMTYVLKTASELSKSDIKKGLVVVAAIEVLFMAIVAVSKLAGKHGAVAGSLLLKMSIAMGIMVAVVKMAASIGSGEVRRAMDVMGNIGILFAAAIAVSTLSGKNGGKAGSMLLKMAAAMLVLTLVVKSVAKLDPNDVEKGIEFITKTMTMFALLMGASLVAGKNAGKAGLMLMGMAVAIGVLTACIFGLSILKPEDIKTATDAIAQIILMMSVAVAATGLAKEAKGTMIALAVSIGILCGTLIALSFLDTKKLLSATASLSIVMLSLAAVFASTKSLQNVKMGKILGTFTGMMLLLAAVAGVLITMSKMNVQSALPNAAALSMLLLAIGGVMFALSKTSNIGWNKLGQLSVGMVGLAVVLEGLVLVLASMNALGVSADMTNITAVCVLLGAMTAAMVVLSNLTGAMTWKDLGIVVAGMAGLTLVLEGLALVLATMSKLNVQNGIENATALSILLGALSIAIIPMGLIGKLGPSVLMGAAGMGALAAVMEILALVLATMSGLNVQNGIENAKALSILVLALSIAMVPIGLMGKLGPSVLMGAAGAAALAGVMEILALVLATMSGLDVQNGVENAKALGILVLALSAAMVPLGVVGLLGPAALIGVGCLAALAVVLGLAIKAFEKWIAPGLPEMASNLSMFMINLMPFIAGAKTIDASAAEGCKNIASMLTALAGAGIVDAVMSLFGGDNWTSGIGETLNQFGDIMVKFSNKLTEGNFNPEAVNAAANAGRMVTELYDALPSSGGFLGEKITALVGGKDMASFGAELVTFGQAMSQFSDTVKDVKPEAVEAAANAGKMMAEMADTIPNSGGMLADFLGDNTMDVFGPQLVIFGESMAKFSEKVKDIEPDAVEAAAKAGTALADMANAIPNEGGWIAKIVGENDMATFSDKLPMFGEGLAGFGDKVAGVKPDAIRAAAEAGKALAEMANEIPNEGGWISKIVGDNSLDTFAVNIAKLGEGMKVFSDKTDGLKLENVNNAATAIDGIKSTIEKLPAAGCMDGKIGTDEITKINTVIPSLATTLSTCSTKIGGIDTSKLSKAVNDLKKIIRVLKDMGNTKFGDTRGFVTALETVGKVSVDKFVMAFGEGTPKASNKAKEMLNRMIEIMTNQGVRFTNAGKQLIDKFVNGIAASKGKVTTAMTTMTNTMSSSVKMGYISMYSAGSYLVQGLAKGISGSAYIATSAATSVMQAAITAAKEAAGINSPSKVFYEMGGFVVSGFVNALDDLNGKVYNSGYGMADNARKGFSNAISRITSSFDEDSLQPTIRPVLDLSAVESGAGTIGGMFSMKPSIGLLSNVGAVNRMMSNRQNGAGNDDVVYAIDKLRKELGNVGTTNNNYINGITYDDGSNVSDAIATLVRAAKVERRT